MVRAEMIGLTEAEVKEALKKELGVKRMGSKRLLSELGALGLELSEGVVREQSEDSSEEEVETSPRRERQVSLLDVKKPHPVDVQLD